AIATTKRSSVSFRPTGQALRSALTPRIRRSPRPSSALMTVGCSEIERLRHDTGRTFSHIGFPKRIQFPDTVSVAKTEILFGSTGIAHAEQAVEGVVLGCEPQ